MENTFKILGSGCGPGVPSFFCECAGCREARDNPTFIRTRSGALVTSANHNILIDTPPDLRFQLIRENITQLDTIFLTHWHYDHFGGLGELEYYVKLKRKEPIVLYLPPSAVESFASAFPNLGEVFRVIPWRFDAVYPFDQISITPLPANHGIETAGFLINSPSKRLAYFPDTADLGAVTAAELERIDWFICDATFYGENWFPQTHLSMEQAIDLGRKVKAGITVLTHMSVHYSLPVTSKELEQLLERSPNVAIAVDGMLFHL